MNLQYSIIKYLKVIVLIFQKNIYRQRLLMPSSPTLRHGIEGQTMHKHYNRNESNVVDGYVDVDGEDYLQFSIDWIKESARVLRDGKRMFIVSGWSHIADVLNAVDLAGLSVINHIIWN